MPDSALGAFPRTLTVLLALTVGACAGGDARPTPGAGAGGGRGRGGDQAAVPVTVGTVVQKQMPIDIRIIGAVEAYSVVAMHAQITGQLTAVNFKEGEDVKKDQVLFALDRRPLDAALLQAQANLQRDIAQAANARVVAQRYQDLAGRGIATTEQLETSRAAAAALDATVDADRAAVENARVQLQYATIAAPIAGRTGTLMVHEGNLVRAADTSPLVVINQVSPIYVSFGVPEARLNEVKRYMAQGTLRVDAQPPTETDRSSRGTITFIDNNVDQSTGTIKMKGTFPNDDRQLWPGQFVNVVLTLTTDPAAIVVPSAAVQTSQQGQFVFVVKADKSVEMRIVDIARTNGIETVIKSGVAPGETVVTDGQIRLVPGSHISIKTSSAPKTAS